MIKIRKSYQSAVEDKLEAIIERLIRTKEYAEFLIGRNGDFDRIAAFVVRRVKKHLEHDACALTLILPYMTAEYKKNAPNAAVVNGRCVKCGWQDLRVF